MVSPHIIGVSADNLALKIAALEQCDEILTDYQEEQEAELRELSRTVHIRTNYLKKNQGELADKVFQNKHQIEILHKADCVGFHCIAYQSDRLDSLIKEVRKNRGLQASIVKATIKGFENINSNNKVDDCTIDSLSKAFNN